MLLFLLTNVVSRKASANCEWWGARAALLSLSVLINLAWKSAARARERRKKSHKTHDYSIIFFTTTSSSPFLFLSYWAFRLSNKPQGKKSSSNWISKETGKEKTPTFSSRDKKTSLSSSSSFPSRKFSSLVCLSPGTHKKETEKERSKDTKTHTHADVWYSFLLLLCVLCNYNNSSSGGNS